MSRVSVIAQMNIDLIYSGFPGLPSLGEEVIAKDFSLQLGGGPQVIPILLSRFGIDAKLGIFLGNDNLSRLAVELLNDMGFDRYENLYQGNGKPVVITSVFSFPEDRSFLGYNEAINDKSLSDDQVYSFLKGSDYCFAPHSIEVLKKLKSDGATIFYDTGWSEALSIDNFRHILKYTDIFTPNDKEAMKMTGTESPGEALRKLSELVKYPIVKTGKHGCIALDQGEIIQIGAIDFLEPVDSTGAGDNFLAGLLYGMCMNWDIKKCMQMANITGGYSTTALGCFGAGITKAKAMNLMDYYDRPDSAANEKAHTAI